MAACMLLKLFLLLICVTRGARSDGESCGVPNVPILGTRIVGGHEARQGSWPWMVLLAEDNQHVCGGSIIGQYFILTAAHCFEDAISRNPRRWTAFVGKHHLTRHDPTESVYYLETIFIHEAYNNETYANDIAMVQLTSPITFNDYVKPVCIPPTRRRVVPVGRLCYTAGWGDTLGTGSHFVLNQVALPIISEYWCSRADWYGSRFIHGRTFCAGYTGGGKDACVGDSGGPFVCKVGDKWYQQGVVSWGYMCAKPHWPGIYTDVSKYGTWIRAKSLQYGHPLVG